MLADRSRLEQEHRDAWAYARQARAYTRRARARLLRTQEEVKRAYRRTLAAALALSMPAADDWTRDITAAILVRHGLLDDTPAGPRTREGRPR